MKGSWCILSDQCRGGEHTVGFYITNPICFCTTTGANINSMGKADNANYHSVKSFDLLSPEGFGDLQGQAPVTRHFYRLKNTPHPCPALSHTWASVSGGTQHFLPQNCSKTTLTLSFILHFFKMLSCQK